MLETTDRQPTWVFLTNHAQVLLCIARDPDIRARDIADQVKITERAAQRILADLVAEGYLKRTKIGRRNRYQINRRGQLRHPAFVRNREIGPLLDHLIEEDHRAPQPTRRSQRTRKSPKHTTG